MKRMCFLSIFYKTFKYFFPEIFCRKFLGTRTNFLGRKFHFFKSLYSFIECFRSLWRKKYARFSVYDGLGTTTNSVCNNGCSRCHGFHWHKSKVFFWWEEKCFCIRIESVALFFAGCKNPLNIWFGFFLKLTIQGIIGIGSKFELFSIFIKGFNHEVEFFIRNTPPNPEIKILFFIGFLTIKFFGFYPGVNYF